MIRGNKPTAISVLVLCITYVYVVIFYCQSMPSNREIDSKISYPTRDINELAYIDLILRVICETHKIKHIRGSAGYLPAFLITTCLNTIRLVRYRPKTKQKRLKLNCSVNIFNVFWS